MAGKKCDFGGDFERTEGAVHLGGGNLAGGGLGKAELAEGEAGHSGILFSMVRGRMKERRADGWAEGATQNGAVGVEVAGLGDGVEYRARVGVSPLLKELNGVFVGAENAGCGVAGKEGGEMTPGSGDALKDL